MQAQKVLREYLNFAVNYCFILTSPKSIKSIMCLLVLSFIIHSTCTIIMMSWLPQPILCGLNHHGNQISVSRKTTHDSHLPFSIFLPLWRCGFLQAELRDLTAYALQHWKQVWVDRTSFRAQHGRHGSGGLVQKLPEARW